MYYTYSNTGQRIDFVPRDRECAEAAIQHVMGDVEEYPVEVTQEEKTEIVIKYDEIHKDKYPLHYMGPDELEELTEEERKELDPYE
jgi:hypothetical protein